MGFQMIRVMIADDHQLFAEGLSQALDSLPDTRVVGVVNSGPALEEALMTQPAEVSIVDIEMPGGDGIASIERLGRRQSRAIVVSECPWSPSLPRCGRWPMARTCST
jgi:DNA-binding NarL/FixJ family response regulator